MIEHYRMVLTCHGKTNVLPGPIITIVIRTIEEIQKDGVWYANMVIDNSFPYEKIGEQIGSFCSLDDPMWNHYYATNFELSDVQNLGNKYLLVMKITDKTTRYSEFRILKNCVEELIGGLEEWKELLDSSEDKMRRLEELIEEGGDIINSLKNTSEDLDETIDEGEEIIKSLKSLSDEIE